MAFAISKAWDGKGPRPSWMRQGAFVPCDCKTCYFCLNGHTTGIFHTAEKIKVKVVCAKSGLRQWTTKCLDVRVDLNKKCRYCKQCYRKLHGKVGTDGKLLSTNTKKKKCNTSRLGCIQPGCNEHICEDCWAEGYDRHKGKRQ